MPAISQWPVVVSLPGECVAPLPKQPSGACGGVRCASGAIFASPRRTRFGSASGTRFGDVPERVAADVAVFGGVGQRADPHAIEHDPDDSRKRPRPGSPA